MSKPFGPAAGKVFIIPSPAWAQGNCGILISKALLKLTEMQVLKGVYASNSHYH